MNTIPFEIKKYLGDNEITLVGDYYDDGSTDLLDIQLGGESITELIASVCKIARSDKGYDTVMDHFGRIAAEEYGEHLFQAIRGEAERKREERQDV